MARRAKVIEDHPHNAAVRARIGLEGEVRKELYLVEGLEPYRGLAWNSPVGVPSLAIFHAPMIPSEGTAPLASSGASASAAGRATPADGNRWTGHVSSGSIPTSLAMRSLCPT
jgi:hypothetical protein